MNEREAVEKTIEMWEWLRDDPTKNKKDWFRELDVPLNDCYLCEVWHSECFMDALDIMSTFSPIFTSDCPLGSRRLHCHTGNDPYSMWDSEESVHWHESKQAQRIIDACKRWLREHSLEK